MLDTVVYIFIRIRVNNQFTEDAYIWRRDAALLTIPLSAQAFTVPVYTCTAKMSCRLQTSATNDLESARHSRALRVL